MFEECCHQIATLRTILKLLKFLSQNLNVTATWNNKCCIIYIYFLGWVSQVSFTLLILVLVLSQQCHYHKKRQEIIIINSRNWLKCTETPHSMIKLKIMKNMLAVQSFQCDRQRTQITQIQVLRSLLFSEWFNEATAKNSWRNYGQSSLEIQGNNLEGRIWFYCA